VNGRMASLALLGALAATTGGCATVMSGPMEEVLVRSDPPGAEFQVRGRSYKTPCTVPLRRTDSHEIQFVDGPSVVVARSPNSSNPWFYANIVFGGLLLGMAVDMATGAAWDLEPDHLYLYEGRIYDVERDGLPPQSPLAKEIERERARQRSRQGR